MFEHLDFHRNVDPLRASCVSIGRESPFWKQISARAAEISTL
jgi:hypothetical protein